MTIQIQMILTFIVSIISSCIFWPNFHQPNDFFHILHLSKKIKSKINAWLTVRFNLCHWKQCRPHIMVSTFFFLLPILCVLLDCNFLIYTWRTIMALLPPPNYPLQTIFSCTFLNIMLSKTGYAASRVNIIFQSNVKSIIDVWMIMK